MRRLSFSTFIFAAFLCASIAVDGQTLNMKEAIKTAITNYGTIKAKANYVNSTRQTVEQAKREYLPNFTLAAQQDYGNVNGQNGPLSGLGGGLGTASSGPVLGQQNWNAAFGALYLGNVNWDFYTFGRIKEKVNVSKASLRRDQADLDQEIFQHEIRVSAAYLNLLAAQRLTKSQQKNLERATTFKENAVARAKNGLIAGVDSSLAAAEVSNAKIALTKAFDLQQEQANNLGVLLGVAATDFKLDTASINHVPQALLLNDTTVNFAEHPLLKYYKDRVNVSDQQVNYFKKLAYPTFSLVGVMQGRGSGFSSDYGADQSAYSKSYSDGVNPTRGNYVVGIGVSWNLSTIFKNSPQIKSQRYISRGLENEYELVDQQLHAQLALSATKIKNAMDNYNEAPIQVKAASEAYLQKSTLYKNGLTTLVDLTQALYTLNRAETDRDIAYTNVWQALLIKSAAMGNYNIFINEF